MESSYLHILDEASLFELLLRLHYEDLINTCKVYNSLYKISVTPYFQEAWKKYNIKVEIQEILDGEIVDHVARDRLGRRHGVSVRYSKKKLKSTVDFIMDIKDGLTSVYDGVSTRIMPFKNGYRHGQTTLIDVDGTIHYYSHVEDVSCGIQRDYARDGMCFLQEIDNAKRHGLYVGWHANGARSCMVRYVHGNRDGKDITWANNGCKTSEIHHQNKRLHGSYKTWNPMTGDLIDDVNYTNGDLVTN